MAQVLCTQIHLPIRRFLTCCFCNVLSGGARPLEENTMLLRTSLAFHAVLFLFLVLRLLLVFTLAPPIAQRLSAVAALLQLFL